MSILLRLQLLSPSFASTVGDSFHVAVFAHGKTEKLVMSSLPTPTEFKLHEALVDVMAMGINPVDGKMSCLNHSVVISDQD